MIQFKLIKDGSSVRKHDADILKSTIQSLNEDEDSYIILEPKNPIENSIYIQAIKQNNEYYAEIRFVFGTDDNFKHYSRTYATQEEIINLFSQYYTKGKVPNINEWNDDSALNTEETDLKMVKLYKKSDSATYYFEIWVNEDKTLTIHKGKLGEVGETENLDTKNNDLSTDVLLAKYISEQKEAGYDEVNDLTEFIVQYSYEKDPDEAELIEKRDYVESLFNNCLGWTGNGHCDGGDIGSATMNIFCYVVDKNIAIHTILEVLEEEDLLDNLKIAYADEITEEYIGLYPPQTDFML